MQILESLHRNRVPALWSLQQSSTSRLVGSFNPAGKHDRVGPAGTACRTHYRMRNFSYFLILMLAAIVHAQIPQQVVQEGLEKQRNGDLEGAAADYRQFLQIHPEATAIHSNLGAALAGSGQFEEAISEYKIALRQSPALVEARLNLALCYYKMGRIEDATTQLERVHAESPGNHQVLQLPLQVLDLLLGGVRRRCVTGQGLRRYRQCGCGRDFRGVGRLVVIVQALGLGLEDTHGLAQ